MTDRIIGYAVAAIVVVSLTYFGAHVLAYMTG